MGNLNQRSVELATLNCEDFVVECQLGKSEPDHFTLSDGEERLLGVDEFDAKIREILCE